MDKDLEVDYILIILINNRCLFTYVVSIFYFKDTVQHISKNGVRIAHNLLIFNHQLLLLLLRKQSMIIFLGLKCFHWHNVYWS